MPGISVLNIPDMRRERPITERSSAEDAALHRAISTDRIGTYHSAAAATGSAVLDLYLWDRDLAAAFLADIAVLEVALRNAIHASLTSYYANEEWYTLAIGLDDRSSRALAEAWSRLPKSQRSPGRVVARLMFGFWTGLLQAGGYAGTEPQAFKCDYEQLFRSVVHRAFPGGRPEARSEGASFERAWVLEIVSTVNDLRNRAAHHEPLLGGFPLPGK